VKRQNAESPTATAREHSESGHDDGARILLEPARI
jgi:hypothetical protein